jgi:hypothetical protein
MNATRHIPDANHLSVLAATFILAYGMTRFIVLPVREFDIQLPGFYLSAQVGANTLLALLVAGLAATGSDWLLRGHPYAARQAVWPYTLLPALAAWVLGLPLAQLPYGAAWWVGLFAASLALIGVVVGEYITFDPQDMRYPLAAAWLSAVSLVLFLVLAVALRWANSRLLVMATGLGLACVLGSLRVLHLRLHGEWLPAEALLAAFLLVQAAAGLHYWPLTPIQFGVLLTGVFYSLSSLIGNLAEGRSIRQSLLEPVMGLAAAILAAIWLPN